MQSGLELRTALGDFPLRCELGVLVVILNTQERNGACLRVDIPIIESPGRLRMSVVQELDFGIRPKVHIEDVRVASGAPIEGLPLVPAAKYPEMSEVDQHLALGEA